MSLIYRAEVIETCKTLLKEIQNQAFEMSNKTDKAEILDRTIHIWRFLKDCEVGEKKVSL